MDKQRYYQREDVVADYERWRFGSRGGRYVDESETSLMIEFLAHSDRSKPVLDLPCGTGRLLRGLKGAGFSDLWGGDSSPAMLATARRDNPDVTLRCTDAFATGFAAAQFSVLCSLRFLFHVPDLRPFFAEASRIVQPGGWFVFDTMRWTPRGLLPYLDRKLGGRLYCHQEWEVEALLKASGFTLLRSRRLFCLPTLGYRFLPDVAVDFFRWLEPKLPEAGLTKSFFIARRD